MSADINSNNSKLLAENVLKRIQEYSDPKLNVRPYFDATLEVTDNGNYICLLYTSPSPRDRG